MKKLIFPFLLLISLFSCQKDEENNNSSGSAISINGTWVCEESSQLLGNSIYSVYISPHSSITNRVVMDNFYNLGVQISNAQIDVSGNNLTLFSQNINGFDVNGSGTIVNNSKINLSYSAEDGSGIDNVTAVFTKTN